MNGNMQTLHLYIRRVLNLREKITAQFPLLQLLVRSVKKLFSIGWLSSGAKLTLSTTTNSAFYEEDPLQLNYYQRLITGRNLDVIFLDLPKAFDRVPLKLKSNGIDDCLLNWLRHFLVGRKQRVVVRGSCSDWWCVTSGTPQGTILGPLLFLLYINDISEIISSTVKLYADDTKIYREIVDPIKDCQLLQDDLNKLDAMARKWQLRFNADKCESMRITHSRDKSETNYFLEKPPERFR